LKMIRHRDWWSFPVMISHPGQVIICHLYVAGHRPCPLEHITLSDRSLSKSDSSNKKFVPCAIVREILKVFWYLQIRWTFSFLLLSLS
jgi:hypothetical protein